MTSSSPFSVASVTFSEIRQIVDRLPRLDPVVLPNVPASCGKLGDWIGWMARAQGGPPRMERMRLALYAGSHGCFPGSAIATRREVDARAQEDTPLVRVLRTVDADFRIYELEVENPSGDFRNGPALREEEAAHAMAYGMMGVEPGLHLLALSGLGAGAGQAHAALRDALTGAEGASDPLSTLARFGGREVCAILGAVLAARLARVPVLLDGEAADMAAEVLALLSPAALAHCASAQSMEGDVKEAGLASALCFPRLRSLAALVG